MSPAPVAYLWGDDSFGMDAATETFRHDTTRFPSGSPDVRRVRGDAGTPVSVVGDLRERLSTGSMFGGGTLVVLTQPGPLLRRREDRDALIGAIALIADGNGLVIVDEPDQPRKDPPQKALAEAVSAAGG